MDEHRRYRERRIEAQKRARAARKRRRIKIAAACGAALCAAVGIGVFAGNSLFSEGDMAVDTMASVSTESAAEGMSDSSSDILSESGNTEIFTDGSIAEGAASVSSESDGQDGSEVETSEALLELEQEIEEILSGIDGVWSVYVKDLGTDDILSMNNQRMYAASLVKLFVMEASYDNMDTLEANEAAAADQSLEATSSIPELLAAMIQQSDNESYNELVRLESADQSFSDGCHILNDYLETAGYTDTRIYHTLSPSATESESISDIQNHTSVEDCGAILEKIYEGTCISQEASEEMLELLLGQQTVTKIPAGLPEGVEVANKTGETEDSQHDAAIVFGEETDYILCVMSAEWSVSSQAVETIQTISQAVYEYLNM